MEASGSAKRPADNDQGVDMYAFCHNCTQVSDSLSNCDKCGTQLSSENKHISSYGAEPKRARTDEGDSSGAASTTGGMNGSDSRTTPPMNGTSSPAPNSESSTSNATPVPVPQALYVNRNVISTGSTGTPVHPQAIYMNNHVTSASRAALSSPNSSVATNGPSTITHTSSSLSNLRSSLDGRQTMSSGASPSALLTNRSASASTGANLSPTPAAGGSGYTSTPAYPSGGTTASSSRPGAYPGSQTQSPSQAPNHSAVSVLAHMVSIPAQQIRIGAQKFKPLTPVQFKDDGILFTLKDYTYAPVLLNARAILKCKANLSLYQYPLFLLYLEGSCMKQIRNIFGLRDDEFSADSPCEMKRCITIMPALTKEGMHEILTKHPNVDDDLRRMFGMMERRYERYNKILEEITPEEGCDILMSLLSSKTTNNVRPVLPAPSLPAPVMSASAPARIQARPAVLSSSNAAAAVAAAAAAAQQAAHLSGGFPQPHPAAVQTHPSPAVAAAAAAAAQHRLPSTSAVRSVHPGVAAAPDLVMQPHMSSMVARPTPTLVIPTDSARWREMQQSLVVGGVYHVRSAGATSTQYCLWNGTQLVPCRVQNAEVQLECTQVWLGSLRLRVPTKVRIKADQNGGFHFGIVYKGRQHALFLPNFEVRLCQVCRHNNMAALFLDVTAQIAQTLRSKLGLATDADPTLNPTAAEERRKRVILFMKAINPDQWDALGTMQSGRRFTLQEIDIIKALKILAECKNNNKVQQKITDWIAKKSPKPNLVVLENLAKDLSNPDESPDADADDDDDVIMTQEEVGIKCPYTQKVMKDPVRNKICGHNYERAAINDFILRKRGTSKVCRCPYAGCGNTVPLQLADMETNHQLKDYISTLNL